MSGKIPASRPLGKLRNSLDGCLLQVVAASFFQRGRSIVRCASSEPDETHQSNTQNPRGRYCGEYMMIDCPLKTIAGKDMSYRNPAVRKANTVPSKGRGTPQVKMKMKNIILSKTQKCDTYWLCNREESLGYS
ncbi:uncharacterized protein LOC129739871 [Uranotaenia lowii]|uniref:uncharacterized protein LOC129739871 n=1 Tax=Uranotaenia lowii TaxID=190385 RepID=UPI00247B1CBC|nr:uncharacterized protein LOC129739871 [Uranotaenia lowii]